MQSKISMDLSFCQAETVFSLDELVEKLADVFARKAFPELLKMILQLVQEVLLNRIFKGKRNAMKYCHKGHLSLNGGFDRRIRTSLGEFKMTFMRGRCSYCGKTFTSLAKFIDLKRYQTKSNELEKLVVEAIDKLIGYLSGKGYDTAANYLQRAKIGMFGYVRRWLKWGLISPRASSMVERVMRELGRRIKKIAYGWSDKGHKSRPYHSETLR